MKKILVGCPTSDYHDYCLKEYVENVKGLSYKGFDILLVDNSKDDVYFEKIKKAGLPVVKGPWFEGAMDRIISSRNILRQKVLDSGYDYFFSLEQDVMPPKDVIQRLLKHDKKIITGVYFSPKFRQGKLKLTPLIWGGYNKEKKLMHYLNTKFILGFNGLLKVCACGLGCVLIHKSVLEQVSFRYVKGEDGFDDVYFCIDARNKGFDIFTDASIKCQHLLKDRPWKWSQLRV